METAIFTWFGYLINIDERLKLIKNAGFDSVLLWWTDEFHSIEGAKEKQPELAQRIGLKIENVHLPFTSINTLWEDSLDGDTYMLNLMQLMRQCSDYIIPTAVMHLTSGITPPPICKIGLDRFKRIVDCAEQLHVSIAFENLRHVEYLDYILDSISSPNIGVCYDSGHNICYSPDRNVLHDYNKEIMAVHLHDNDGVSDLHLLPFDGLVNWSEVKKDLISSSYNHAWALEVERKDMDKYKDLKADEFLEAAYNRLQRIINL